MKRFVVLLSLMFIGFAFADTINLHWLNEDGTVYENSTCVIDSDLILPSTPPTKYGYTFTGWKMADYTPIEYLESTGTQYIDTGFAFNSELRREPFTMDFTISVVEILKGNVARPAFVGSTPYIMASAQLAWDSTPNSIGIRVMGANSLKMPFPIPLAYTPYHFRYELYQSRGIIVASNDETTQTVNIVDLNAGNMLSVSDLNIHLFKANGDNRIPQIRIHAFSFESNGVKIRDFIPVLDKDGTPCMYDKVTEQFFYNQGTGQFIAGPVLQ